MYVRLCHHHHHYRHRRRLVAAPPGAVLGRFDLAASPGPGGPRPLPSSLVPPCHPSSAVCCVPFWLLGPAGPLRPLTPSVLHMPSPIRCHMLESARPCTLKSTRVRSAARARHSRSGQHPHPPRHSGRSDSAAPAAMGDWLNSTTAWLGEATRATTIAATTMTAIAAVVAVEAQLLPPPLPSVGNRKQQFLVRIRNSSLELNQESGIPESGIRV